MADVEKTQCCTTEDDCCKGSDCATEGKDCSKEHDCCKEGSAQKPCGCKQGEDCKCHEGKCAC